MTLKKGQDYASKKFRKRECEVCTKKGEPKRYSFGKLVCKCHTICKD